MDEVRVDKWLWAARFFKTRGLAQTACELGRVKRDGQTLKPAREVRVGDHLVIATEGGSYEIEVAELSAMRGPATMAQKLYRESESGRERRLQEIEARRAIRAVEQMPATRPSKRDRRRLGRLRGE